LLVLDAFVHRDHEVKFFIHKAKQNTVFDPAPTSFGDSSDQRDAFKLKVPLEWAWDTFIK
jgi:hypothetical protein